MLQYIKSCIPQSSAFGKFINLITMAPTASSNLSSANDIKHCEVPLCDIVSHSRIRKYRNDQNKAYTEESSSDEEAPTVVKKRIVKIISDEEEEMKNSDCGNVDNSDYEVKEVKSIKKEVFKSKSKGLNSYEKMIEKKRAERIALLKSMGIDQIKEEISEAVDSIKQIKKSTSTRSYKKVQSPVSVEPIRRSKRLANIQVDFSESALEKLATKNAFQVSLADYNETIPSEITFEDALRSGSTYKECIKDLSIQESKYNHEFISYNKTILKDMTLHESNVCKVVPARITSASWYPSKEDLIVAAGDKFGSVGLWKIQDSETDPHLFKVHASNIPNMQFCPFNPVQLFTSSYDGTMRCGDLIKRTFNEIYVSDTSRVTWFDFLSPSTFLVSHSNGEVALFDRKTEGKTSEKRHTCHDYTIKTVSVHPVNKNIFITADNKKIIRLWDLRKLQMKPVVQIMHHARCINSAYFSPVTGNAILSTSLDDSICIFDSTNLTTDIKLQTKIRHNNFTGRWLTIFRATWLPNSDDLFSIGSMEHPRRVEIYDKGLNPYLNIKNDNLTTVTSVQRFHPYKGALAAGNSSGKLFVFT